MALTSAEQDLCARIDQHQLPTLLQELVRRKSDTVEADVVSYLRDRWQALHLDCEVSEAKPGRQNITTSFGTSGPSLLLNSHMDTVPAGDPTRWSVPAFSGTIRDGRLYGRGSVDAKGCLAPMIAAYETLATMQMPGRLTLSAVAYEENGGYGTMHDMKRGLRADAAIVGEPTNLQLNLGHRGACRATVTVRGVPAHSAHPHKGVNAITAAAPMLLAIDALNKKLASRYDAIIEQAATVAVTMAEGGDAPNVIPAQFTFVINRRTLPGEQPEEVLAELEHTVRSALVDHQATVTMEAPGQAVGAVTEPAAPIAQTVKDAITDGLGYVPRPTGFFACCDMTHITQSDIPTVIFGPGEEAMCHVYDESMPVVDLYKAAKVYALTAFRWAQRRDA